MINNLRRGHSFFIRIVSGLFVFLLVLTACCDAQSTKKKVLADRILKDTSLTHVDKMARILIKEGFHAGSGYSQIWARDLNTFIETALEERPAAEVRGAILLFFKLQQDNGEMVDGYVLKKDFTWHDDTPYYSDAAPNHVGFKNTVETDQETSLIQLLGKYIQISGDTSILTESIAGQTVMTRIERMLDYLHRERHHADYELLWGAMTADWGDVQPHDDFGCDWNTLSHQAIDVYDNAMLVIALEHLIAFAPRHPGKDAWQRWKQKTAAHIRQHLWDANRLKFIPHIYPNGSPLPKKFDENTIHYHGGTAVAIEAGILTPQEITHVYQQMVENVQKSGMPSIGLTLYPTYPGGFFHGTMAEPYIYQNGGDWTWFGGRMIQQLIVNGFVEDAYTAVRPMLDRVIKNQGFYEWYDKNNKPSGSGNFKGSAGVLAKSITLFTNWAKEVQDTQ
ncbi:hypothetical protein [Sphingobacterium suaedae]|uniref:Glycogen debranching enzyme C-terminal domain-containing protein n=1 Tax=Sphingobacterium suaedae TaxID=1686402 RepID=A0ABW5KF87_9SPHI